MKKRPIRIEGEIGYVPLADSTEATIDAEDAELVGKHNWCFNGRYVVTALPRVNGKQRRLGLHRLVMGDPEGKLVDHRNNDPRMNQKAFLRPATKAENGNNRGASSNNTSGHKGVTWYKRYQKWHAKIQHEGKKIHLGYFTVLEEAAQAYREAAAKYHGEFANFGATT
jgi:AP2 domain